MVQVHFSLTAVQTAPRESDPIKRSHHTRLGPPNVPAFSHDDVMRYTSLTVDCGKPTTSVPTHFPSAPSTCTVGNPYIPSRLMLEPRYVHQQQQR